MSELHYLHAIAGADILAGAPPVAGMVADRLLFAVTAPPLVALCSTVPPDWIGTIQSAARAEAEALAVPALCHQRVMAELAARGDVLPVRFGTLFPNGEAVREYLLAMAEQLVAGLNLVAGAAEWALRLSLPADSVPPRPPELPVSLAVTAAEGPGVQYLRARIRDQWCRDYHRRQQQVLHDTIVLLLQRHCRALCPQPAGAGLWRGSLLLPHQSETLRATIHQQLLAATGLPLGVEWSGPWPPYSFAREAA